MWGVGKMAQSYLVYMHGVSADAAAYPFVITQGESPKKLQPSAAIEGFSVPRSERVP